VTIKSKLTEKYPPKSEFGRGFLICLVKFAEHAEAYLRHKERIEQLEKSMRKVTLWLERARELESACEEIPDELREPLKWLVEHSGALEGVFGMVKSINPAWLWWCGASDHLLGLECPDCFKETKVEENIKRLNEYIDKCRYFGEFTEDDVVEIHDLVREIALLVDRHFGLEPDIGEY